MNRLICFFGCSACGKETLIKHIYSGYDEKLNSNLGIDLKNTIILDKSIEYISKHRNDNITEKRFEIIHDIISLCSKNDNLIILIKGQNSDIRNNFIQIINENLNGIIIDIVYVTADVDDLIERVRKKDWYDTTRGDTQYLESIGRSLKYMDFFQNYKITYIKSNPNFEYEIISQVIKTLSKRRQNELL